MRQLCSLMEKISQVSGPFVCLSPCDVYCSFPATVPECGLTTRMCFDEKRKEVVLMTVSILEP